jgi:hypothetical protein
MHSHGETMLNPARNKVHFSDEQLSRAREMRAAGMSWGRIGARLGCADETIRNRLDPDYRALRASRYRGDVPTYHVAGERGIGRDEAERVIATVQPDTRSRFARFMGDPLPGRSALDRRTSQQQTPTVRNWTDLLAPANHGEFMEDHLENGRVV